MSRAAGSARRRLLVVASSVGCVVALLTHTCWALVDAFGVYAAGALLAAGGAFELMKRREHVSLEVAARLEEEGVTDPDRVLTELLRMFATSTASREATACARFARRPRGAGHGARRRRRQSVRPFLVLLYGLL